jgi:nicotinate-nucleotide pyrophosphorylase (carboxylating)
LAPDLLGPQSLAGDAQRLARIALAEDGARDVTSLASVLETQQGSGIIEARESLVLSGRPYADAVVTASDLPPIAWQAADGDRVAAGTVIGVLHGSLRGILRAERPLLNFLQRAAGVATMTREAVERVADTECVVLHTRKTTPGLRLLEVRAVLDGGGGLHRVDLATTAMIKDNHWQALRAAGRTLADGIETARALGAVALQVEVESLDQLLEACRAGATRLLIDNQSPGTVREWTDRARTERPGIQVEATGGITIDTIAEYARTGVDFVSTGLLTHSVRSADLGLEVRRET